MLELFYALYREQTMEEILYTMAAETVRYGMGRIEGGALAIGQCEYPHRLCAILQKGDAHNADKLSWKDIDYLKGYFLDQLGKNGYMAMLPLLGRVKSRKFRMDIRKNLGRLDPSIRRYIETGGRACLDGVDPGIKELKFAFPENEEFSSFYRDSQDMVEGYLDARSGNPRNYEEYYTKAGKKRRIDPR